jgi:hypothetical protein
VVTAASIIALMPGAYVEVLVARTISSAESVCAAATRRSPAFVGVLPPALSAALSADLPRQPSPAAPGPITTAEDDHRATAHIVTLTTCINVRT